MELAEVVRRRRMVRAYDGNPVPPEVVDRMLEHATRAPSAGFTQGWAFLVLDAPDDVDRFWEATTPPERAAAPSRWLRGMRTAPVVLVPLTHKDAYLDRYAEPDKGWTDRDEARWPVPYWYVDTGMASLLVLLTAVDEGLGACFFGIPPTRTTDFRSAFGVPDAYEPLGAITVGYGAEDHEPSSRSRGRRPREEVVHRGRW
ncbi:nitroreductase family protein [Mumia sp. Pv 4-285]|uniref:nitroreductase family protein n=1 Tax=Mumia qirimensis TaxID=3234852 RepID=UPI00351D2505